jgi:hypothetical protein
MKAYILAITFALGTALPSLAWADHQGASHLWLVKPLLLATLALGYWILRASRQDPGYLQWVGLGTGGLIMVASLSGLVCSAYHSCYGKHSCPVALKTAHECPHHSSAPGQPKKGAGGSSN